MRLLQMLMSECLMGSVTIQILPLSLKVSIPIVLSNFLNFNQISRKTAKIYSTKFKVEHAARGPKTWSKAR